MTKFTHATGLTSLLHTYEISHAAHGARKQAAHRDAQDVPQLSSARLQRQAQPVEAHTRACAQSSRDFPNFQ